MDKVTHVDVQDCFRKPLSIQSNIFNDNIAYVEQYDFSTANLNEQNRIAAVSCVASICYANPKAAGSINLYDRLACEAHSLPSSSFEFVPVLIPASQKSFDFIGPPDIAPNIMKFGETVHHNGISYILTNYRAIIFDVENKLISETALKFFNTPEECEIIKQHFKVFKFHVDMPTRSQMVRHRVNWQELSRRYVSGERVPFDFYISEKMQNITSVSDISGADEEFTTQQIIDLCLVHYYAALNKGIKPQEARRIIPQAAYTTIWGAFQPTQLANYFKLRGDSHAQWEIQQTAKAMKSCIVIENYKDSITPEREAEIQERLLAIESGNAEFITTEELELLIAKKQEENKNG